MKLLSILMLTASIISCTQELLSNLQSLFLLAIQLINCPLLVFDHCGVSADCLYHVILKLAQFRI